jgi:hypothetical protein
MDLNPSKTMSHAWELGRRTWTKQDVEEYERAAGNSRAAIIVPMSGVPVIAALVYWLVFGNEKSRASERDVTRARPKFPLRAVFLCHWIVGASATSCG